MKSQTSLPPEIFFWITPSIFHFCCENNIGEHNIWVLVCKEQSPLYKNAFWSFWKITRPKYMSRVTVLEFFQMLIKLNKPEKAGRRWSIDHTYNGNIKLDSASPNHNLRPSPSCPLIRLWWLCQKCDAVILRLLTCVSGRIDGFHQDDPVLGYDRCDEGRRVQELDAAVCHEGTLLAARWDVRRLLGGERGPESWGGEGDKRESNANCMKQTWQTVPRIWQTFPFPGIRLQRVWNGCSQALWKKQKGFWVWQERNTNDDGVEVSTNAEVRRKSSLWCLFTFPLKSKCRRMVGSFQRNAEPELLCISALLTHCQVNRGNVFTEVNW